MADTLALNTLECECEEGKATAKWLVDAFDTLQQLCDLHLACYSGPLNVPYSSIVVKSRQLGLYDLDIEI